MKVVLTPKARQHSKARTVLDQEQLTTVLSVICDPRHVTSPASVLERARKYVEIRAGEATHTPNSRVPWHRPTHGAQLTKIQHSDMGGALFSFCDDDSNPGSIRFFHTAPSSKCHHHL